MIERVVFENYCHIQSLRRQLMQRGIPRMAKAKWDRTRMPVHRCHVQWWNHRVRFVRVSTGLEEPQEVLDIACFGCIRNRACIG